MARFYGKIGYGESVETKPGVWQDVIIEKEYYGDVLRVSRQLKETENLNDDITIGNSFRIVADAYASTHFFAMRYIEWQGARWTIQNVDVDTDNKSRLSIRPGGVYNGPGPIPADEEGGA